MATTNMNVDVAKLFKDRVTMNIKVTGLKTFRVRFWLGCQLIKLAALVAGCGIRIDNVD